MQAHPMPGRGRPRSALSLSSSLRSLLGLVMALLFMPLAAYAQAPSFMQFESGPVRPMAMSPDRSRLFVANTPNNTLDVFSIGSAGLQLAARVPVGLEPVSVAVRSNTEVWVVNHLSDSVSIVDLGGTPRVVRTLLVGDEPRDIVFAGNPERAFITTAHRGQQRSDPSLAGVPGAGDPQLTTPGIGRADVWVFNPASLGSTFGGLPLRIMTFFSDTPRALAVSPDRSTVYVAAFKSGNQTTTVLAGMICGGFNPNLPCLGPNFKIVPGGNPGPKTNFEGKQAPEVGLIVKFNKANGRWEDELKRNWNNAVQFSLPDRDVFAVDANTLAQKTSWSGVGTVLFNMVTNPVSGAVYVSNTEAINEARFEGPGTYAGHTVQGKLAQTRITVLSGATVSPRHLNKHIDYSKLPSNPGYDWTMKNHSLAMPLDMAVTGDGRTLYVAAFSSSRIGVFDTAELENDSFNPRTASARYIELAGGGPSGLVLDEARGRLYVTTRFDNAVKVIDLASRATLSSVAMKNPEPARVTAGRPFLYDARRFSANGEASCASCHTFGDADDLAWDLGNPDDRVTNNPITKNLSSPLEIALGKLLFGVKSPVNGSDNANEFHPMKGPMTTQTLRGMRNSGAMHWRGDRATGIFGSSGTDSTLSFKNFAVAFEGLLGGTAPLSEAEMQQFADFQIPVMLPPNPIRKLDNTLTASQQRGRSFYSGTRPSDGIDLGALGGLTMNQTAFTCEGCHRLDPASGFFGTGGRASFEGITQIVKIPHLRNMYQKVGMFGSPRVEFFGAPDTGFLGEQVRGFGFVNDGSVDTLFRFFTAKVFNPQLTVGFPILDPDATRRDVVDFMMAFDSDLAPIVGQQVTLNSGNASAVAGRINLLLQRAATPFTSKELGGATTECSLVVRIVEGGVSRGLLYNPAAQAFVASDGSQRSDAAVRALATVPGQEATYTCAPPGSGARIAFDS